jgi:FkbM family methyltransferase
MTWKEALRKICWTLHLDVTQNMRYDRATYAFLSQRLKSNSNTVDVGCHKGEVLEWMIQFAPQGFHEGFEPIPSMAKQLKGKFQNEKVSIKELALSDNSGQTQFHWVKNAPAYSGIKRRAYAMEHPEIEHITVQCARLDDACDLPSVDLIKIDVEGGEWLVLQGCQSILKRDHPDVIFEFGKGASEFYQTTPEMIFDFFDNLGYQLFPLNHHWQYSKPLTRQALTECFESGSIYYFFATVHRISF